MLTREILATVRRCAQLAAGAAALGAAGVASGASSAAPDAPLLHDLFQDHAVLQREQAIRVWGNAEPGAAVTVSLADANATARADSAGRWKAVLPAMQAGGPYSLEARSESGTRQIAADVLIGDVWLCAGQSNMQLPVHRALDSRAEIAGSANDRIRMLTVGQAYSPVPRERFAAEVKWRVAAPATVPDFSATCFFFARELHKREPVPLGLINASWGGSRIESWLSAAGLQRAGGYDEALELLALSRSDRAAAERRWGEQWQSWWRAQPSVPRGDEPWRVTPRALTTWRQAPQSLGPWEMWGVPELAEFDGLVWYATTVNLDAAQARQEAVLALGAVDEVDQTWVNGIPVGSGAGHDVERRYALPRGALRSGVNSIVVAALDTYGNGGIVGPAERLAIELADGGRVPLTREWHYRMPPADLGAPPRAPWESTGGITTIRNGMLAPLGAYAMRGVAWYQGESNTHNAKQYERLLTELIGDWRALHGAQLPFLIVQLANYGMPPVQPQESDWAALRETQRRVALRDPHAGLAVTVDIGDRYDIHPANKQEVGRRLARAARHVAFGERVAPSGPIPVHAMRHGDSVAVAFADITGALVAYGARGPIGFELCGSESGSCRYVDAAIAGEQVTLRVPQDMAPTRIRYCWADSPVCTLYDTANLPAGPFEIEVESRHE